MVNINGKTYQGNVISIVNGKVYIDGKVANEDSSDNKIINITIHVTHEAKISIDHASAIQVYGSVDELITGSGNVEVMGNVQKVKTGSGNVKFETLTVGGDIKTGSGNVKYKRVKE